MAKAMKQLTTDSLLLVNGVFFLCFSIIIHKNKKEKNFISRDLVGVGNHSRLVYRIEFFKECSTLCKCGTPCSACDVRHVNTI